MLRVRVAKAAPPGPRIAGGAGGGIGALANALAKAGVRDPGGERISDAVVFAASGGIGFHYVVVGAGRAARMILEGTARGSSARTDLVDETAVRLGATVVTEAFDDEVAAENALVGHVQAGAAAVVWVDRASMPYDRMPLGYERTLAHLVGVVGCDLASEELRLDDRAARVLPIDATRLRLVRALSPVARSRLGVIRAGERMSAPVFGARVLASLAAGAAAHAGSPLGNRGIAGMRTLALRIRDPSPPQAWRRLYGRSVALFHAHAALYRYIEEGTGTGMGRALLADALVELGTWLNRPDLAAQAAIWRALAARWTTLAHAALPDSVANFGAVRGLLAERHRTFLAEGLDNSGGLAEKSDRLARLTASIELQFPVDGAAIALFHGDLAASIEGLAAAEAAAAATLSELCRA